MDYVMIAMNFLVAKFPVLSVIGANTLAIMLTANLLIEGLEAVAKLTPTAKDDDFLAKAKEYAAKAIPFVELIPHVNIPLTAGVIKATEIIKKIAGGLKGAAAGVEDKK